MTKYLKLVFFILILDIPVYGQTKKELEEQRRKTQEEINYIDNLLKETERKREKERILLKSNHYN
ncbi:MAG TPA: hypothetical protein PK910_06490, partial [Bacteroidales bacterium]|nr:hypothetical protein [Bacteroidales bacterium]